MISDDPGAAAGEQVGVRGSRRYRLGRGVAVVELGRQLEHRGERRQARTNRGSTARGGKRPVRPKRLRPAGPGRQPAASS